MKKNDVKSGSYKLDRENGSCNLVPEEPVTLSNSDKYEELLGNRGFLKDVKTLNLDCSHIESYDSYFVIFYDCLRELCRKNNVEFKTSNMTEDMGRLIDELAPPDEPKKKTKKNPFLYDYFVNIGNFIITFLKDLYQFVEFLGDLVIKFFSLFIHPTEMRWKDFPFQFTKSGVNAVPIVLLIVFLIGVITGYQGAIQLHRFGADKFLSHLVGVSITRELAPLMTAILVAGRSGSAFAAEIGTMKVSDEIDALKSMGYDYIKFLVLPRVLAVTVAMPLLTLMADVSGIIGGLITAVTTIDVTIGGYLNELQRALTYADIFSGLFKSLIFGFLVATVGCFRGLQVHGGAESVGKYTTISVVSGVLLIILADAVFTFVFQSVGIGKL